jgi:protein-tyrosine-phosphatase
MAEAFGKMRNLTGINFYSAGSRPSGKVNPKAIDSMKHRGYDLSHHRSKSFDDLSHIHFDMVVSMGCGDDCPFVPSLKKLFWDIPDPRSLDSAGFNEIRDMIENHVSVLIDGLVCTETM